MNISFFGAWNDNILHAGCNICEELQQVKQRTDGGFPNAETFAASLGQAVWLMTVSKHHRNLKVRDIEALITPAILLRQFKIYMRGKQPVAFIAWASVSDEVKSRFTAEEPHLESHEWRSGPNILIVDCVSPFAARADIERQFEESIAKSLIAAGVDRRNN